MGAMWSKKTPKQQSQTPSQPPSTVPFIGPPFTRKDSDGDSVESHECGFVEPSPTSRKRMDELMEEWSKEMEKEIERRKNARRCTNFDHIPSVEQSPGVFVKKIEEDIMYTDKSHKIKFINPPKDGNKQFTFLDKKNNKDNFVPMGERKIFIPKGSVLYSKGCLLSPEVISRLDARSKNNTITNLKDNDSITRTKEKDSLVYL